MDWKALLKEFNDKLAEAIKDLSGDERTKAVAEATDALPQEARQHLHDAGHAEGEKAGKADAGKDAAAKDREIAKLKKDAEKKDAEITTLREAAKSGGNPDAEAVRKDYEKRLSEKDEEVEAAKEQAKKDVAAERLRGATARLTSGIGSRVVSDAIARGLSADPELAKRIAFDDDGAVTVYQADGKTPLALKAGQDPIDGLVADVVGSLDKTLLKSTSDGGSGAAGGGDGEASEFDAIREEVKQQYAAPTDKAQNDRFERL